MAEKVSQESYLSSRCRISKSPKNRTVKVVHIANPTIVHASVSEFPTVVQSLTGRKRSSTSPARDDLSCTSEEPTSEGNQSPNGKVPRLKDATEFCSFPDTSEPAIAEDMARDSDNSHGVGRCKEFKDFESEPKEMSDILRSSFYDPLESFADVMFS